MLISKSNRSPQTGKPKNPKTKFNNNIFLTFSPSTYTAATNHLRLSLAGKQQPACVWRNHAQYYHRRIKLRSPDTTSGGMWTNDRGETTASYRRNGWVWELTGQSSSRLQENDQTLYKVFMEYTSKLIQKYQRMSPWNLSVGLANTRISTNDHAQNPPPTLMWTRKCWCKMCGASKLSTRKLQASRWLISRSFFAGELNYIKSCVVP